MISFTLIMTGIILASAPQPRSAKDLEKAMDRMDQLDCSKIIESAQNGCKDRCVRLKTKTERQNCLSSCNAVLENVGGTCKKTQKIVKDFKKKPKTEQDKLLKEAIEKQHVH